MDDWQSIFINTCVLEVHSNSHSLSKGPHIDELALWVVTPKNIVTHRLGEELDVLLELVKLLVRVRLWLAPEVSRILEPDYEEPDVLPPLRLLQSVPHVLVESEIQAVEHVRLDQFPLAHQ